MPSDFSPLWAVEEFRSRLHETIKSGFLDTSTAPNGSLRGKDSQRKDSMCGIVGIAGRLRRDQLLSAVNAMNVAVTHRGPDDEGAWVGENFAFGMRRLSIIDLAGGHQPILTEDGKLAIIFNGEIYNYRALRSELEARGHRFQTASDTEVIMLAYREWGADSVRRLR
jgi:asparagine synthase (glutamine-hydrolysing)